MAEEKLQLLLKSRGSALQGRFALAAASVKAGFTIEPLFSSIGVEHGTAVAATAPRWSLVAVDDASEKTTEWDLCHALVSDVQGIAAGRVEFVEPDLLQQWPTKAVAPRDEAFAVREGSTHRQNGTDFPAIPADNFWFRDAEHGQFPAFADLTDPGPGRRVRIAHLDTGFDPDHRTCPMNLSTAEQRNFVEANAPKDARDRSSGILNNFSHGTGTLSILAGAPVSEGQGFGCAPFAEVIPIRVANRVVLFRNSTVARAFDYVHGLCRDAKTRVHVVTMSMGGLPSQAWAEAINALYDAGVLVVAAAGNNYANKPSHFIVYPARFNRVVAACGVMADGTPYADLAPRLMAGDYGPDDKMATAIAAYTPNVPWARIDAPTVVDFDGEGTSAATPQVAGAAALWIERHRDAYDAYREPWMQVEAVRRALFAGAAAEPQRRGHFGAGKLRTKKTLEILAAAKDLRRQPKDDATFTSLKILFGLAIEAESPRNAMLGLELRQVLHATGLEGRLLEAESPRDKTEIINELLTFPKLSRALRRTLGDRSTPQLKPPSAAVKEMERLHLQLALKPAPPAPPERRLRVFAYDPSLQTDIRNFGINEAIVSLRWEENLQPGPIGEYLEIVDIDPASNCCYAPVDLNNAHVLAQNGLQPSEANPQFHQQMVYAVAMRTIARFERALGRRALWAEHVVRGEDKEFVSADFVPRLRIYPHALREENAYYSRNRMALLFGYFNAQGSDVGTTLPGARVFCAVSHDIIAHETTHALLDGLHPRYQEATNTDMLAFHEGFADVVALFQHFTMPEALLHQIKQSGGDVRKGGPLGELAQQFGKASGMHGALRSFIGEAKPDDYTKRRDKAEPHALGAVLVSAIFAAFDTIYRARSADLIRLATSGSGILPAGQISHDLAGRLAREAAKVADQVLNMCIRALDYCPPVDLNFGDYLRAIITADRDLVPNDDRGYRVAFISAFRDRGIFPSNVRHLAEDSLVWETPPLIQSGLDEITKLVESLDLRWSMNIDRKSAYDTSRRNGKQVRDWLRDRPILLDALGFEQALENVELAGMTGELRPIEVHSVRPCRRTRPDGTPHSILVIEITQTFWAKPDKARYRGGCSLLVDLQGNDARYIVRKRLRGESGAQAQRAALALAAERAAERGLAQNADGGDAPERFALLHRIAPRS